MTLAETQDVFWSLATTAPEPQKQKAEEVFTGAEPLGAVERMRIYANMFLWRQIHVLRADYPKLVAAVGDAPFYQLSESYLREYPSTHHSVSKLGRFLPEFLTRFPVPRPDLVDLAKLELARTQLVEEKDATPAPPDFLQGQGSKLPGLRLGTIPALRLLSLDFDVLKLWHALDLGHPATEVVPSPVFVAVWRKNFEIFHAPMEPAEAEALRRLMNRQTFENVCQAFQGHPEGAQAALRAVGAWFVEGWIVLS